MKYTKSVLWRLAKRLFYIEDARCLKVKRVKPKCWDKTSPDVPSYTTNSTCTALELKLDSTVRILQLGKYISYSTILPIQKVQTALSQPKLLSITGKILHPYLLW